MRKFALVLSLLPLVGCQSFTWHGHGTGLTAEQKELGLKDITALSQEYDSAAFFRGVRRRSDGRNNAFGNGLMGVQDFIDRHFWNYDKNDPAVNYPSNTTKLEHFGRFMLVTGTSMPGVDEITNR
jgi:hypothetical protein